MASEAKTMRELVGEQAEDVAALAELREFERALNELWSALADLVATTRHVADDLQLMNELGRTSPGALAGIATRMAGLAANSEQLVRAFGELCRGVRGWAVATRVEGRRHSVLTTPVPVS